MKKLKNIKSNNYEMVFCKDTHSSYVMCCLYNNIEIIIPIQHPVLKSFKWAKYWSNYGLCRQIPAKFIKEIRNEIKEDFERLDRLASFS